MSAEARKASLFEFAFANGVLTPARTFVVVPQAQRGAQDFIGDVAFSPDGRLLYAANLYRDSISVVNPQSGMVIGQYQDRPPPLPHSVPSRRQELLRHATGRMARWASTIPPAAA